MPLYKPMIGALLIKTGVDARRTLKENAVSIFASVVKARTRAAISRKERTRQNCSRPRNN